VFVTKGEIMLQYPITEINKFAKLCARGSNHIKIGSVIADEITHSAIGSRFPDNLNQKTLLEISRKYAQAVNDINAFDVDTGEVQKFQHIIEKIHECCEENNWFENDRTYQK